MAVAFSFYAVVEKQKQSAAHVKPVLAALRARNAVPSRLIHSQIDFAPNDCLLAVAAVSASSAYSVGERAPLPENETRAAILSFVSSNPGVQFRAICSSLGLSIGVVQFHLIQLKKAGLIDSIRRGKYRRFFVAGRYSLREMETIAALRLTTVKTILAALLNEKALSHRKLAEKAGISSQGLTWQMKKLCKDGMISPNRDGLKVSYSITPSYLQSVDRCLRLAE